MNEQCKNSRLLQLLMIVVHGETLWSPAPLPMDDDDELKIDTTFNVLPQRVTFYLSFEISNAKFHL